MEILLLILETYLVVGGILWIYIWLTPIEPPEYNAKNIGNPNRLPPIRLIFLWGLAFIAPKLYDRAM